MKDIVDATNIVINVQQDKTQAKANYKDFIEMKVIVTLDGNYQRGQDVRFSLSGTRARFKELANQKIIGTTDSSGTVTVHVMSSDLEKGTVTVETLDSTGQPNAPSKSCAYEFIKDPALSILATVEKNNAKANGSEQDCVAVKLLESGQPMISAVVHASVDGKATFVTGSKTSQATTDSQGIARFYVTDSNNLHENVNFNAYYEQALWLQANATLLFVDANHYVLSTEVISNFNIPGKTPNTVRIKVLNNNQIAAGVAVNCSLPSTSGATFARNGSKQFPGTTDAAGYLSVDINDTKVEKVRMDAQVPNQTNPEAHGYADLEWQDYTATLTMPVNNSLPDGITQNIIQAVVKNGGAIVSSEGVIFKIDDRSQSTFVATGTTTCTTNTDGSGIAKAGIVSHLSETYPVIASLARYPTIHSSINSTFGTYVLTVVDSKNDAYGDGLEENWVKVSLTNSNTVVSGKALFCEMLNKKGIFTNNKQYTTDVTTDQSGCAVIHMVGSGSIQDKLRVSVKDYTSVFKEVDERWRTYTIAQVDTGQVFTAGSNGSVTVAVKDNGNPVPNVNVQFSSPYSTTVLTNSTGTASAQCYSANSGTVSSTAYLKDRTSVITNTSIKFIERYICTYSYTTSVQYGYDITFIVNDNLIGGALRYNVVHANLTLNSAGTPGIPDIWFEDTVGLTTPVNKDYETDGNGKLVVKIRYLLPPYYPYLRNELLTLKIDGKIVATRNVQNY